MESTLYHTMQVGATSLVALMPLAANRIVQQEKGFRFYYNHPLLHHVVVSAEHIIKHAALVGIFYSAAEWTNPGPSLVYVSTIMSILSGIHQDAITPRMNYSEVQKGQLAANVVGALAGFSLLV